MGGITTTIGKVKYIGIASLTIAILSILILNIISSYSSSNTLSNAEQVNSGSSSNNEPSTLANDSSICDPTNTNAESCISLSITSSSSSTSTGGNDANLSLQIPREGGIATGRHTVTVNSNNYTGYYVTLTGNAGSPAMVPSTPTSQAFIQSTTGTLTSPSPLAKGQWGSWGIALPNSSLYPGFNTNEADYNSTNQDTLAKTTWAAVPGKEADDGSKTIIKTTTQSRKTDAYPVYYGVRVDSPVSVPADTYAAQVVYTATTNEVPMPTITSIMPNSYQLGSGGTNTVTIEGTNLSSAYRVYLVSNTDSSKRYDITTENITSVSDTQLKITLPTDKTNPELEPGDYTIHVVTQGGEGSAGFTYEEGDMTTISDDTQNVDVTVDQGMIPVTYTGTTTNAQWTSLTTAEIKANPRVWFDYTGESTSDGPRWANAVTVKEEALGKYQNKHEVVDEADVLGYWVYIPRYAYQVQRKEVSDHYVSDTLASNNGGFNIRFETASDFKKEPVETCSTEDNNMFYTDMNGMESEPNYVGSCHTRTDYPTRKEDYNQTAWATHPAFTWGDEELNGFWIGKFETTGTESSPTVLPNEYHQYPSSIGDMYDVAKSMGVEDPNNKYGNTKSTNQANQNNNNLAISTSHMLKNSEWGAVTYLASSKYGAGINNVQLNNSHGSGGTGTGPSGGAYNTVDGQKASTTNNIYGVYDMAGGAYEYVMGSYTTNASQSMTDNYLSIAVKPPYVDLYVKPPFSGNYTSNNNLCTWATCGGHALYETKNVQSVSSVYQSWGGDYSDFVHSGYPWFLRGGGAYDDSYAGLFGSDYGNGYTDYDYGFRVALLL